MKSIPTDIITFSKMIKNPEKDFSFDSIVPENEFQQLSEIVFRNFFSLLIKNKEINREVFFIDTKFLGQIIQILHVEMFKQRAVKKDYNLVLGPNAKKFYNPNWIEIGSVTKKEKFYNNFLFFLNLKEKTKNFFYNQHSNMFKNKNTKFAICLGTNSGSIEEFAKKNNLYVKYKYAQNYLKDCSINEEVDNDISVIVRSFLKQTSQDIKKDLNMDFNLKNIQNCWEKRLSYIKKLLQELIKNKKIKCDFLLVSQAMNTNYRIIASAFKNLGGQSIAFDHGYVPHNKNTIAYHFQPLCYNKLITCGLKSSLSLEENLKKSEYDVFLNNLKIENIRDKQLYNNFLSCKNKKLPNKISKVMIMGFPMNNIRYAGGDRGMYFYYRIFLEIDLINYVKSLGYNVLYKIHPDRISGTIDIIKSLDVEIIKDKFEKIWKRADIFIFPHTSSTTFGYALTTNRKIILLNSENAYWNKKNYSDLKKRCSIIDMQFKNRFFFPKEQLKEELRAAKGEIDHSYVLNYLV